MKIVSLTTDFGASDWFVGTMKGVILAINPKATVVDITHEIAPGDIRAGAFALMASWRYFPKGTVHVAVIDPGVGSRRQAIAAQTANGVFIGPDNGVLSWALKDEEIKTIRLLENRKYFLEAISRTFHGRDIFAPAAAHVSRRLAMQRLGRELKNFCQLPWPAPMIRDETIEGEIVYLDRFGNAITNIAAEMIRGKAASVSLAAGKRRWRFDVSGFYAAVPANQPVAVIGSFGLLEVSVNGGSAAQMFRLKIGDHVMVERSTCRKTIRQVHLSSS
jgi:S-adenosyl-L-methionine hydrolase (adenosine-forming)